jgi:hypothetical protein
MQVRHAGALAYPPAPVHPVIDRGFGHAVVDPYRRLETGQAPTVEAWWFESRLR